MRDRYALSEKGTSTMHVREYLQHDLERLVELTIDTFGPFYEDSFRPLVGEVVFAREHGSWRQDYRTMVPALHDPPAHQHVAVAEDDGALVGYVAWKIDPARRRGEVEILAVQPEHRRFGIGEALCEHAFGHMRQAGVDVVVIGTGGDAFHAPARALYASLGLVELPVSVFYRQL